MVVIGIFCPSLLCYHYSDTIVVMGRLPVIIVTYNLIPQCMFIVVHVVQFSFVATFFLNITTPFCWLTLVRITYFFTILLDTCIVPDATQTRSFCYWVIH
jgi:hypothetical protein